MSPHKIPIIWTTDITKNPKQANMPKIVPSVLVVKMAKFPLAPNRASIIQMNRGGGPGGARAPPKIKGL